MIKIDEAIELSKNMTNVSNGGSACYDFGDVVLVKYVGLRKYEDITRENEEIIKDAIDVKVSKGVNIPRHLEIKRMSDDQYVYCYVLQEKAKGINGNEIFKNAKTTEELLDSLKYISSIPMEHYNKLVKDVTEIKELGYEGKPKNFFYDEKEGFTLIDFIDYKPDKAFNPSDVFSIFETVKYNIPYIVGMCPYHYFEDEDDIKIENEYLNIIETKKLLAMENEIPQFSKYKKFYILQRNDEFKHYLVDNKIYDGDLFSLTDDDYKLFDELCDLIINKCIKQVLLGEKSFYDINTNDLRNDSILLGLSDVWLLHKDNIMNNEKFEDEYDYKSSSSNYLEYVLMNKLYDRIKNITDEYSLEFISQYEEIYKKKTS